MFQINFAVKQTERLCSLSLEYGKFLARESIEPRVFSHPFSGLKVNTRVFQEISMCAIFFSIVLPFPVQFIKLKKSFNLILNCFIRDITEFQTTRRRFVWGNIP